MKKILVTVLAAAVVIVLLAGCAQANTPSTTPSVEPSATVQPTTAAPTETASPVETASEAPKPAAGMFTLKNGSMSIAAPDGWASADMSTDAMALGTLMSADLKGTIALASVKLPAAPGASLLEQTYNSSATGAVPGGTIVSQSNVTIGGVNGKLFEIKGQSSGKDVHCLLVVLIKGDVLYTATGMAVEADFAAYKDIFANALNSLVLN